MHRCFLNSLSGVQEGEGAGPASIHRAPREVFGMDSKDSAHLWRGQSSTRPPASQAVLPCSMLPPGSLVRLQTCREGSPWSPQGWRRLRGAARHLSHPVGQHRYLTATFFQDRLLWLQFSTFPWHLYVDHTGVWGCGHRSPEGPPGGL